VLRRRGHRVVFLAEESFAGRLADRGFEERLVPLARRPSAPVSRKSTIDQLEESVRPRWQALVDGVKEADVPLAELIEEVGPDVIVQDNVIGFPAVITASCPWVRIMSGNPLELPDPGLPPAFSGYPADDRSGWDEFREEYRRTHADLHADFDEYARGRGCPPLPELEFIHRSAYLNLFLYPEEADYERSRPLGPMWDRLDSCVRTEGDDFDFPDGDGPLVYLSLGSLGSADAELMKRLTDLLDAGGYRTIVSEAPQQLPQPAILPLVDAVITHGGNNTVTECLHFGKPMVLLPLLWDQHDNAQRMHELGLGRRLATFEFEDAELGAAIDGLVADEALADRLQAISSRLRDEPGTEKAADLIESSARRTSPTPVAPPN
jgi:UDP:flavonoid glycosyltransferase YjiC (YdhE family)